MDTPRASIGLDGEPWFVPAITDPLSAIPRETRALWLAGGRWDLAALREHLPSLTHVMLTERVLGRADLDALDALPALSALSLTNCALPPDVASGARIARPTRLTVMASGAPFGGDAALAALVDAMPSLESLTTWCLRAATPRTLSALAGRPLRQLALNEHGPVDGDTVAALGRLTGLRSLTLRAARETLATRALPALAGTLPSLRSLAVTETHLLDDKALAPLLDAFPGLESLSVQGTRVKGAGLDRVAAMPSLRQLDVAWSEVTGKNLAKLAAGCATLEDLDVGRLGVTAAVLDALAGLRTLRVVRAYKCRAGAWLAKLAAHGAIEWIDLSYGAVADASLAHIAGATSLRRLDLASCDALSDKGLASTLARLPSLEAVYLGQVRKLGDRTLDAVSQHPALRVFETSYAAGVTDAGVRALAREGTRLRTVNLQGCASVTPASVDALVRAAPLDSLVVFAVPSVGGDDVARWRALRPSLVIVCEPERTSTRRVDIAHDEMPADFRIAPDPGPEADAPPGSEGWPVFDLAADASHLYANHDQAWSEHPYAFARWSAGPSGERDGARALSANTLAGVCVAARGVVVRIRGAALYADGSGLVHGGRDVALVFHGSGRWLTATIGVEALVELARQIAAPRA